MERKPHVKVKKHKKYKDDEYYHIFKEKMKQENFDHTDYSNFPDRDELRREVKNRNISKKIVKLPDEVQKKIYILRMKKYWRDTFLNRSLKPLWATYNKYLNEQLKLSVIDNVHFMHLEFNTLPENKKWIPSCECRFCKDYQRTHPIEVRKTIKKLLSSDDGYDFCRMVNCYDDIPNKWNREALYYGSPPNYSSFEIFNPVKMLYEDIIKESFEDSQIYFGWGVIDVISEILEDEGYSWDQILQEAQANNEIQGPGEEPGQGTGEETEQGTGEEPGQGTGEET